MSKQQSAEDVGEINSAISLAEAALAQCDKAGLIFAAIYISSALDNLKAERLKVLDQ